MPRKQDPRPAIDQDEKAAEILRLRDRGHLNDEITEKLGFASTGEANRYLIEAGKRVTAGMTDAERGNQAWLVFHACGSAGWVNVARATGYDGPHLNWLAMLGAYRAVRNLFGEADIAGFPTAALRKRARAWNEELAALEAAEAAEAAAKPKRRKTAVT